MEEVQNLISKISSAFGTLDILVNNSGISSQRPSLVDSDPLKWWTDIEANVHWKYFVSRAFIKYLDGKSVAIINMSAGVSKIVLPGRNSEYSISKGAVNRMTEYIAAGYPNIIVVSLDPGSVLTEAVNKRFRRFSLDTPELIGGFAVCLTSKAASFLTGRFVRVNWDVEELVARKDEILAVNDLKTIVQGQFDVAE